MRFVSVIESVCVDKDAYVYDVRKRSFPYAVLPNGHPIVNVNLLISMIKLIKSTCSLR